MTINKLDTKGYWMVGSNHIYIPSTPVKVEHSNIAGSSSGRDETGVMHIDWVRRDVRKVFLNYKVISASEVNYLLGLMQGKEFTFKFYDHGAVRTINAYASESSYEYYNDALYDEPIYINFSLNVIEK